MFYGICRACVHSWSAVTKLLTLWNSVFLEKRTVSKLVHKLFSFFEILDTVLTSSRLAATLIQVHPVHSDPSCSFEVSFNIIFPIFAWVSKSSHFFRFLYRSPACTSLLPYACHVLSQYNSLVFYYSSNTMRLVVIQSPPGSYSLLQLRPKYPPQHPTHKHP